AYHVGNFIDAFDVDESGVHVHGQNLAITQAAQLIYERVVDLQSFAFASDFSTCAGVDVKQMRRRITQAAHPLRACQGSNTLYVFREQAWGLKNELAHGEVIRHVCGSSCPKA